MARRRYRNNADRAADDFLVILQHTPVWVGPVIALAGYLLLRFVIPPIIRTAREPYGEIFGDLPEVIAPLVAFFVLFVWVVAEIKKFGRRRLFASRPDLASLRRMSWQDFEKYVGEAFRMQGYVVEETGGGGADGGVDLVLRKPGQTILVQCKRWSAWKVGVKTVRELYGVLIDRKATGAVLVTCRGYTADARTFAEEKPVELMDSDALWRLVETGRAQSKPALAPAGVADAHMAQPAPLSQTGDAADRPLCPSCGSPMVLRTARKGPNPGSQFYGCSRFPECRGIRQV